MCVCVHVYVLACVYVCMCVCVHVCNTIHGIYIRTVHMCEMMEWCIIGKHAVYLFCCAT